MIPSVPGHVAQLAPAGIVVPGMARLGARALFLGRRPNAYVIGLLLAESEAMLDALWAHATQPRFTFQSDTVALRLTWGLSCALRNRRAIAWIQDLEA